jgi:Uma2 family endonuclease
LAEDSRVELIDGELIEMAPVGGPHMAVVNRLNRLLVIAADAHLGSRLGS